MAGSLLILQLNVKNASKYRSQSHKTQQYFNRSTALCSEALDTHCCRECNTRRHLQSTQALENLHISQRCAGHFWQISRRLPTCLNLHLKGWLLRYSSNTGSKLWQKTDQRRESSFHIFFKYEITINQNITKVLDKKIFFVNKTGSEIKVFPG